MDIDPFIKGSSVIKSNWLDNKTEYANMIGDGVVNLDKKLTQNLIKMASKYCKNLVVRSFVRKQEGMLVASYFPEAKDFKITPYITRFCGEYNFYVWRFYGNHNKRNN